MTRPPVTARDRALAKVCECCPVCLHARYHQQGLVYQFVEKVETRICPFCAAYERVHGHKAHEKRVTIATRRASSSLRTGMTPPASTAISTRSTSIATLTPSAT